VECEVEGDDGGALLVEMDASGQGAHLKEHMLRPAALKRRHVVDGDWGPPRAKVIADQTKKKFPVDFFEMMRKRGILREKMGELVKKISLGEVMIEVGLLTR